MNKMKNIILASASPRRKELLHKIVDDFQIINSSIKETLVPSLSNYQKPVYIAKQKAKAVFKEHQDSIIIAADTIVVCKRQILGKPQDEDDAFRMMKLLQGNTHTVISGVCILSKDKMISFNSKTLVTFNPMSDDEIRNYLKEANVYDKAGAYSIQEEAGKYISKIEGDYYNVVGLPLSKLYEKLKKEKYI